jgi:hypothetical protein
MTLAVHALDVCVIVTPLGFGRGHFTRPYARDATAGRPDTRTDRCAMTAVDRRTSERAEYGARKNASRRGVFLSPRCRLPTDGVERVLTARPVVEAEFVESPGAAGQCEIAGARRHRRAAGKERGRDEQRETNAIH